MRFIRPFLFLLSSTLFLQTTADEAAVGTIQGRLQLPDSTPFNTTTKITLNHGERTTYTQPDGKFIFQQVPPGIHVLDVHSPIYHFSQLKVQLLADDMANPKVLEYYYPGATKHATTFPIVWTALATYDYFEPRGGFSIFGLLKNPMLLMMIMSVGMMFLMPKMMDQMEPEEKERMKKQMALQSDPTKMFGQLWGELTGGSTGSTEPAAGPSSPASSPKKKQVIKK